MGVAKRKAEGKPLLAFRRKCLVLLGNFCRGLRDVRVMLLTPSLLSSLPSCHMHVQCMCAYRWCAWCVLRPRVRPLLKCAVVAPRWRCFGPFARAAAAEGERPRTQCHTPTQTHTNHASRGREQVQRRMRGSAGPSLPVPGLPAAAALSKQPPFGPPAEAPRFNPRHSPHTHTLVRTETCK
jgi:hypothetical protein